MGHVWGQTTNPALKVTCPNNKGKAKEGNCGVEGFVPISTGTGMGGGLGPEGEFGGLEYDGRNAFIEGSATKALAYVVGARKVARNKCGVKGFPGHSRESCDNTQVELYVWSDATMF